MGLYNKSGFIKFTLNIKRYVSIILIYLGRLFEFSCRLFVFSCNFFIINQSNEIPDKKLMS